MSELPDEWPMCSHCGCIHDPEESHACEGTRTEGYIATIADLREQVAEYELLKRSCGEYLNYTRRLEEQVADLRERHEAFVRTVKMRASLAACIGTALVAHHANEIIGLCDAELGKEGE